MMRRLAATALVALVLPLVATASASAPVTVLLKEDTTGDMAALSYSTPVEFDDSYDHIPLSYANIGFKVVSTKIGQPIKIRWTLSCEGKGGAWSERSGMSDGRTSITVWRTFNPDGGCIARVIARRAHGSPGHMIVSVRSR
jgi:hypothetical protein